MSANLEGRSFASPQLAQFYKVAGIYKFTNKINGKVYVGQSQDIYGRYRQHARVDAKAKGKTVFGRAIKSLGIDAFCFEVLEIVSDLSRLNEREQYWMDSCQCYVKGKGYNTCKEAGTVRGYSCSEEERKRRSEFAKLRFGGGKAQMLGKKLSDEARRRISEARKGKPLSPEHRAKCGRPLTPERRAQLNKGIAEKKRKKIAQIDIVTGAIIKVWSHAGAIQNELGYQSSVITVACNGGYYHKKNNCHIAKGGYFKDFKWEYAPIDAKVDSFGLNKINFPKKVEVKKIAQIDIHTGTIIRVWNNARAIAKELETNPNSILCACRGGNWRKESGKFYPKDSHVGFKWNFISEDGALLPPDSSLSDSFKHGTIKRIAQIDKKTGATLRIWESAKKVQEETGLKGWSIGAACRGEYWCSKRKKYCTKDSFGGFKWQYVEQ